MGKRDEFVMIDDVSSDTKTDEERAAEAAWFMENAVINEHLRNSGADCGVASVRWRDADMLSFFAALGD